MSLAEKVVLDKVVADVEKVLPLLEQLPEILDRLDRIEKKLWAGQVKK